LRGLDGKRGKKVHPSCVAGTPRQSCPCLGTVVGSTTSRRRETKRSETRGSGHGCEEPVVNRGGGGPFSFLSISLRKSSDNRNRLDSKSDLVNRRGKNAVPEQELASLTVAPSFLLIGWVGDTRQNSPNQRAGYGQRGKTASRGDELRGEKGLHLFNEMLSHSNFQEGGGPATGSAFRSHHVVGSPQKWGKKDRPEQVINVPRLRSMLWGYYSFRGKTQTRNLGWGWR